MNDLTQMLFKASPLRQLITKQKKQFLTREIFARQPPPLIAQRKLKESIAANSNLIQRN